SRSGGRPPGWGRLPERMAEATAGRKARPGGTVNRRAAEPLDRSLASASAPPSGGIAATEELIGFRQGCGRADVDPGAFQANAIKPTLLDRAVEEQVEREGALRSLREQAGMG